MPRKNSGVPYSTIVAGVLTLSNVLPRRQPARMPIHRPMPMVRTVEIPTSEQRVGQRGEDLLPDRLGGVEAAPEVTAQRVADVLHELIPLGAVETEAVDDRRALLLAELAPTPIAGERIAIHDAEQEEVEHQHHRQKHEGIDHLPDEEAWAHDLLSLVVGSLSA